MNQVAHIQHQTPGQALQALGAINAGAVAIEQERAIAEVQAKIAIAKRFPRDDVMVRRAVEDACRVKELAETAFYSVPRAGGTVTGPSIRLAEELARCSGNIDYGHRELSRTESVDGRPGKSEVEVYAWDMQSNTSSRRQITIPHWRDTKSGGFPLRDTKDVDDLIANKASKQLRSRILAIVPKGLLQFAMDECRRTIAGGNGATMAERLDKMVKIFGKIKVTPDMLQQRLGHPIGETTEEEMADLFGIFQSIKDGHTTVEQWMAQDEDGADGASESDKPANLTAHKTETAAPSPAPAPAQRQRRQQAQKADAQANNGQQNADSQQAAAGQGTTAKNDAPTEQKDAAAAQDASSSASVNQQQQQQTATGANDGGKPAPDEDDDAPF